MSSRNSRPSVTGRSSQRAVSARSPCPWPNTSARSGTSRSRPTTRSSRSAPGPASPRPAPGASRSSSPGTVLADLGGGAAFVLAVPPLHQVRVDLGVPVAHHGACLPRPLHRAGQHQVEGHAGQPVAQREQPRARPRRSAAGPSTTCACRPGSTRSRRAGPARSPRLSPSCAPPAPPVEALVARRAARPGPPRAGPRSPRLLANRLDHHDANVAVTVPSSAMPADLSPTPTKRPAVVTGYSVAVPTVVIVVHAHHIASPKLAIGRVGAPSLGLQNGQGRHEGDRATCPRRRRPRPARAGCRPPPVQHPQQRDRRGAPAAAAASAARARPAPAGGARSRETGRGGGRDAGDVVDGEQDPDRPAHHRARRDAPRRAGPGSRIGQA